MSAPRPARITVPAPPGDVLALAAAIRADHPGWTAGRGANGMWHGRRGRLEAHGGSDAELREGIESAERAAAEAEYVAGYAEAMTGRTPGSSRR